MIAEYRLIARIARGGMGEIWEAIDSRLHRTVALKLIRPDRVTPQLVRRFDIESRAQARLQHQGIAQIFQADTACAQPFIVMELIRGAQRIDAFVHLKQLNVRGRLELLQKVADAVAYAHEQSVIHLDLKPSNILVREDGQPKILDFGGGQLTDEQPFAAEWDVAVVTPAYMSPEQGLLDRRLVDARSDVYTLGVIGYELLTGRLPYDVANKTFSEAREVIAGANPLRPMVNIAGAVRREAGAVILRALEHEPAARFQTSRAFDADLRALLAGTRLDAADNGWQARLRRWLRRDEHIPRWGQILSGIAGLNAIICLWFLIAAVAVPAFRQAVTPNVRVGEFVWHEGAWAAFLTLLAVSGSRSSQDRVADMWIMLAASLALTTFTFTVASGMFAYDVSGAVTNAETRGMVFTVLTALASVASLVSALMVASHYLRAPWRAVPGFGPG
jgi:serine/threonine-protein kinase